MVAFINSKISFTLLHGHAMKNEQEWDWRTSNQKLSKHKGRVFFGLIFVLICFDVFECVFAAIVVVMPVVCSLAKAVWTEG